MKKQSCSFSLGGGIASVLFIVFLVMKLSGAGVVVNWSWWWVASLLWIFPAILLLALLLVIVFFKPWM